jgi:DNA-binding GntR family transcriptional regulator
MTNGHLQALEASFGRMNESQNGDNFEKWILEHRSFHCLLCAFSGKALLRQIERLLEQSTRFHYMFDSLASGWLTKREADHAALLEACKSRRPHDAYQLMLDHLAETALTLLDESSFPEGRPPGPAIEGAISIASAAARQMKVTAGSTATTPLNLLLPVGAKERGG